MWLFTWILFMSIHVRNQFEHRFAIADKTLRDSKASLFVYMIKHLLSHTGSDICCFP